MELASGSPDVAVASFNDGIDAASTDKDFQAQVHLLRGFTLDLLSRRNSAIREYETDLALPNVENSHKNASRFERAPYQGRL